MSAFHDSDWDDEEELEKAWERISQLELENSTLKKKLERRVTKPYRDIDQDIVDMSYGDLQVSVLHLRNGIRKHRDERGHDRCWMDDQRLYSCLPETIDIDTTLPPRECFLKNCEKFYENRQNGEIWHAENGAVYPAPPKGMLT